MGTITQNGFIPSTPQEIKASLISFIKQNNPSFFEYPADLIDNLIDTSIADLMQYEILTETMLNTIAPQNSNEWLFSQFAEFFGLNQHSTISNTTTLSISGLNPNSIIPSNLVWTFDSNIFINSDLVVADENGDANIIVNSNSYEEVVPANSTWLSSVFNNAKITNTYASLLSPTESFTEYKQRIQANFRCAIQNSFELLSTQLNNIGITKFSIHANFPTEANAYTYSTTLIFLPSIMAVYNQIKPLVFSCLGMNDLVLGITSDNDTSRVKEVEVDFFNTIIKVPFVLAKIVPLDIKLSIKTTINADYLALFINEVTTNLKQFIAELNIGSAINVLSIENIVLNTFKTIVGNLEQLQTMQLSFTSLDKAVELNGNFLSCTAFDVFIQVGEINVIPINS